MLVHTDVHVAVAGRYCLTWQATTWKLPLVSVPVLSKLTTDTCGREAPS